MELNYWDQTESPGSGGTRVGSHTGGPVTLYCLPRLILHGVPQHHKLFVSRNTCAFGDCTSWMCGLTIVTLPQPWEASGQVHLIGQS